MLKINTIRKNTYDDVLKYYHYVKLIDASGRIALLKKPNIRHFTPCPNQVHSYNKLKAEWEAKLPVQYNIRDIIDKFVLILQKNRVPYNLQPRNMQLSFSKNDSHILLRYNKHGWVRSSNNEFKFDVEFSPKDVFDLIHRLERFRILEFKLNLPS